MKLKKLNKKIIESENQTFNITTNKLINHY